MQILMEIMLMMIRVGEGDWVETMGGLFDEFL